MASTLTPSVIQQFEQFAGERDAVLPGQHDVDRVAGLARQVQRVLVHVGQRPGRQILGREADVVELDHRRAGVVLRNGFGEADLHGLAGVPREVEDVFLPAAIDLAVGRTGERFAVNRAKHLAVDVADGDRKLAFGPILGRVIVDDAMIGS